MPLNDQERQQLQQILNAMQAGLTGSDAMSMIDQVESSMQARMEAQRAAKGELIGAIGATGLEAAQSGMSENDLAGVVESMQAQAGLKTGAPFEERISETLAPLWGREPGTPFTEGGFPTQSFVQQTQGMPGGLSPLANIGFDESDVAAINAATREMKAQGLELADIRKDIYNTFLAGPPDPITGQPTVDEAGQEFTSEFGGLIDQAIRNAYLAAPSASQAGVPPMREDGGLTGPTGATGPTGPSPSSDFNAAGILATGATIGAGGALVQGARGAAAPYGGGATGFLRGLARHGEFPGGFSRGVPMPSTSVPNPDLITDVVPAARGASSSGGVLGFLRALGSGHFGLFPDYLPPEMAEDVLFSDVYQTRPA